MDVDVEGDSSEASGMDVGMDAPCVDSYCPICLPFSLLFLSSAVVSSYVRRCQAGRPAGGSVDS